MWISCGEEICGRLRSGTVRKIRPVGESERWKRLVKDRARPISAVSSDEMAGERKAGCTSSGGDRGSASMTSTTLLGGIAGRGLVGGGVGCRLCETRTTSSTCSCANSCTVDKWGSASSDDDDEAAPVEFERVNWVFLLAKGLRLLYATLVGLTGAEGDLKWPADVWVLSLLEGSE